MPIDHSANRSCFASPPCFAHELAETADGFVPHDAEQARDVQRWRVSTRKNLLAQRAALSVRERQIAADAVSAHVHHLIAQNFSDLAGHCISGYWPIKSELDLRPLFARLTDAGATIALPVVDENAKPLSFHAWREGDKMERGFWGIAVPAQKRCVTPDIVIAPLVGWDRAGYRLGYGGGYFDRTLAAMTTPRFVIGIGLDRAELKTIFPQPHDIGFDAIVTESGLQWQKSALV